MVTGFAIEETDMNNTRFRVARVVMIFEVFIFIFIFLISSEE
jgi:hypothetical protein